MATYHLRMNVGMSGKTIPHLNYICRSGKFSKKEDLIYSESGRMPQWATSPKEFWKACADKDKRAYREIEFALPNELSREQQLQLVKEYVEEIIPDKAYTFAIHEVDSAVHGIKNPHVHLMFSERIIDDRTSKLSQEEFFQKRGVKRGTSRQGQPIYYGGSVKDRSWAGTGRNSKIYEVRELLAQKINEKYIENGIEKEVTHLSKKDEAKLKINKGNIESTNPITERAVRIPERIFLPLAPKIKEEIYKEKTEINPDLPDIVQSRIFRERNKMAIAKREKVLDVKYQTLKDSVAIEYGNNRIIPVVEKLQENSMSPLAIIKKRIDAKVEKIEREKTEDPVLQVISRNKAAKQMGIELAKQDPIKVAAEIVYQEQILKQEIKNLEKKTNPYDVATEFLTLDEQKQLEILNEKRRSKESIRKWQDKKFGASQELKAEIEEIKAQRKALIEPYTEQIEVRRGELQKQINDKRELLAVLQEMKPENIDKKELEKEVEKIKRVAKKQAKRKQKAVQKIERKVKTIRELEREIKRNRSITESKIEEDLVNLKTGGKVKEIDGKIRSKVSLSKFLSKKGESTWEIDQEIDKLRTERWKLIEKYKDSNIQKAAIERKAQLDQKSKEMRMKLKEEKGEEKKPKKSKRISKGKSLFQKLMSDGNTAAESHVAVSSAKIFDDSQIR